MTPQLLAAIAEAYAALGVLTKTPKIRQFLLSADPMALNQGDKAFAKLEREMDAWEAPK